MDQKEIEKAAEILEKSGRIGIVLPPKEEQNFDSSVSAEVLMRVLESKKKAVGALTAFSEEYMTQADVFPHLAHPPTLPEELIISCGTTQSPIAQIRYEKKEDRLDIFLSPAARPVREEDISFRKGSARCDCIIALERDDGAFPNAAGESSSGAFADAPIINIGTRLQNRAYGAANCVEHNGSLTEIVALLLLSWGNDALPHEQATLLLAGMLQDGRVSFPSGRAAAVLSELIRMGADYERARSLTSKKENPVFLRLLGRAFIRSRYDEARDIVWSFLTAEDFELTGRTDADIPRILRRLEKEYGSPQGIVVIWQNPNAQGVRTTLAGSRAFLSAIGAHENAAHVPEQTYPTFQEAEQRLSALIENAL